MTWWGFVKQVKGSDNQKQIAAAAGVTPSAVSRWESDGNTPGPDAAASLARHYGRPVLEAFIAAGFLTEAEAEQRPAAPVSLADLDDEALLDEVRGRMRRGGSNADAEPREKTPGGAPALSGPPSNVVPMRPPVTEDDLRGEQAVADNSPREPSVEDPEQPAD